MLNPSVCPFPTFSLHHVHSLDCLQHALQAGTGAPRAAAATLCRAALVEAAALTSPTLSGQVENPFPSAENNISLHTQCQMHLHRDGCSFIRIPSSGE